MKKIDKPQDKEYGPIRLWLDELAALLSELEPCKDVTLIADDVKYESLEEFIRETKGRRPSFVRITASGDSYISIDLMPRWARLYVSSSSVHASGLLLKLDSILTRCEKRPRFLYRYSVIVGCAIVLPIVFWLPFLHEYDFLGRLVSAVTFAWLLFNAYLQLWRLSIVYPMRREERPSFIKRNFDTIVVVVISALLGAILGVATTKLFDRILPSSPNQSVHTDASQAPRR